MATIEKGVEHSPDLVFQKPLICLWFTTLVQLVNLEALINKREAKNGGSLQFPFVCFHCTFRIIACGIISLSSCLSVVLSFTVILRCSTNTPFQKSAV